MWKVEKFCRHRAALVGIVSYLLAVAGTPDACAQSSRGIPRPDHVVIVVEENRAYGKIIGASAAPYINSLAQRGAVFTEYFGVRHPSQPNYLAMFSGSTQGVGDDSCPHRFDAPNLGTSLLDGGFTFAAYSEGLPAIGSGVCESGGYARKHAPWINFTNLSPQTHLPFSMFPSDFNLLPTVSFVVPNLNNDMHDGSTERGDAWLQEHLDAYLQWAQTNNSLLIVTWDEAGKGSQIATLFVGPMVQSGMYGGRINHYHLLRTLEDMFGLPYAGYSADVPPIANVWRNGNPPPDVVLTSPADGAVFTVPTNILLAAEAFSSGGPIAKVEFFSGVTKLGEASGESPVFVWSNVPPGNWSVSAKVIDSQGGMSASPLAAIRVNGAAVNPFLTAKGLYAGLLNSSNPSAFTNSGHFTLKINAVGKFAGKLTMDGAMYSLRGRFDGDGSAHSNATRPGKVPLAVELQLDLFGTTDQIRGTVSDGTWTAILDGNRPRPARS